MPSTPVQYAITPWRHSSELLTTRQGLYTPINLNERTHALATIAAWKLRGNLPHAIESTALLFSALQSHQQSTTASSAKQLDGPTLFALRSTYTLALSRFVTGFADLGRHRTGPGQSMFDVARSINLPPHFVELRHEAAHEELPSLARLVSRTEEALRWLWGIYWGGLDAEVEVANAEVVETAAMGLEERKVEVRGLLKRFRTRRIALLKAPKKNREIMGEHVQDTCEALGKLCGRSKKRWSVVVDILVGEGMIVPSQKLSTGHQERMRGADLLWTDLLVALATTSSNFFESLVSNLIAQLPREAPDEEITDHEEPLLEWLSWIRYEDTWENAREQTSFDLDELLMQECCLNPGYYSRFFAGELLDIVQDDAFTAHWDPVFQASMLGSHDDAGSEDNENAMDISEPGDGVASTTKPRVRPTASNSRGWRQEAAIVRPLPIGVVQT